MTRKDYKLIADSLKDLKGMMNTEEERKVLSLVAFKVSQGLAVDNPRFDRQKFLEAAGLKTAE